MTAMVVNQDHYINEVFSGGGTYTLDMDTFGTPYVTVFMRTLVDAADQEDVAAVNAIQDQMAIDAVSSKPFITNAKGFFEPNDRNAYNVKSVTGARNDDGSITVHLRCCEDDRVNCLLVMEGWNYTVRMYRPSAELLNGSWMFPKAVPVN